MSIAMVSMVLGVHIELKLELLESLSYKTQQR